MGQAGARSTTGQVFDLNNHRKEAGVLKYIVRRLLVLPVIMFLVTLILFFLILQIPPEQRAAVYVPSVNPHLTERQYQDLVQITIERPASEVNVFEGTVRKTTTQAESILAHLDTGGCQIAAELPKALFESMRLRSGSHAFIELSLMKMRAGT